MSWRKRSAFALLGAAVLVLAVVAGVFWVAGTDSGTAWLVRRLLADVPALSIERIRGSLLGGLTLDGVRLRTARDELDIDSLELDWNPPALLAGTLSFDRAAASRAVYRRLAGGAETGAGPPQLPWPVRLEHASAAALTMTIAGRTLLFDATTFAGTYGGRRLVLENVAARYGSAELAANAAFELGDGIELDVAGEWSGAVAGVAANGRVTLAGVWPQLALRHELGAPFTATTVGTLFASPFRVDVVNEWQDLAWPGVASIASPRGRLALAGAPAAYSYQGTGSVVAAGRSADFAVEGTGERLELALASVELAPAPLQRGTLRAAGAVSLAGRTASLELAASRFDPAWLAEVWPGELDGTATLRASIAEEPTATLEAIELAGKLRGYAVEIDGAAALTGRDSVRLTGLRLESADNFVLLDGTLDGTNLDLHVDAELAQLDLLLPEVRGALAAELVLGGTWRQPRGRGTVRLTHAELAGVTLERLDARGEIGLAPDAIAELTVDAAGLARGPLRLDELRVVADGTAASHTARIEAVADDVRAVVGAAGGFVDDVWRGALERVDVAEPRLGPWRLDTPADLAVGRGVVTLSNSCLLHVSRARWCTELDVRGRPEDRLVVSGQNFNLATLRPLLPPALEIDGVYQLSGSLLDLMGEPRGAVALTGGTTRARVALGNEQAFTTELERVQAGLTLTAGRLELTAGVRGAAGGGADLKAAVADVRSRDSAIEGLVRGEWPDLGFVTLLSPELGEVAGALAVDLTVGGTVAEPTADGRAAVTAGRISVPRWGLVVDAIEGTAASSDGRSLDVDAAGRVGDGVLMLAGSVDLDPQAGWPARLELRGDSIQVVQRADAEIFATPDLAVTVALPVVEVTGRVHVPRASLRVERLPEQAVAPSPDAVVHTREQERSARPLRIRTNIELTLGDDVRYAGLDLDTTVAGELRLATEPGRSPNATGTLLLAGTYDAYGQQLMLDRGQLLFSGPMDDPGLDVRAVRRFERTDFASDATEVGIELTGTLKAPRTRVYSSPAMSEADALSYLLFGRPASSSAGIDSEETSTLQAAALSLGLQQALPVVQRIGDTLGLDELTVQSTATDAGALMAGKYLSPRLYLRYSYGLFNRIGGLLLRFKVNERLSIETRSGEQKSMDLLYTVEKD